MGFEAEIVAKYASGGGGGDGSSSSSSSNGGARTCTSNKWVTSISAKFLRIRGWREYAPGWVGRDCVAGEDI